MLMNMDIYEQLIFLEPRGDTFSIMFDNWKRLSPLFPQPRELQSCNNLKNVDTYMDEDGWGYDKCKCSFLNM